jgi:Ni,Fe-hydrogenase III large subunit
MRSRKRGIVMNDQARTNGGSVRDASWRDVPMQRWCEREIAVTDGHLTTASGALWWTCESCDLEVDVTDQVQRLFKGKRSAS